MKTKKVAKGGQGGRRARKMKDVVTHPTAFKWTPNANKTESDKSGIPTSNSELDHSDHEHEHDEHDHPHKDLLTEYDREYAITNDDEDDGIVALEEDMDEPENKQNRHHGHGLGFHEPEPEGKRTATEKNTKVSVDEQKKIQSKLLPSFSNGKSVLASRSVWVAGQKRKAETAGIGGGSDEEDGNDQGGEADHGDKESGSDSELDDEGDEEHGDGNEEMLENPWPEEAGHDDDDEDDNDDEGDETDDDELARHEKLLYAVTGKPIRIKSRNGDVDDDDQNDTQLHPLAKASVNELMAALQGGELETRLEDIKKKLERVAKTKVEQPQISKVEQARLERSVAYERDVKSISRYQALVNQNREAAKLVFPLPTQRIEPRAARVTSKTALTTAFEPSKLLEKQITEMLAQAGVANDEAIIKNELLEVNHVSKEQLQARARELAQIRSILFFEERRSKRIKKIKSRKFRKLKRAEEDRKRATEEEELELEDPESARERREKSERERIEERMTLRHRNTSKWIQRKLKRGEGNFQEGTRQAIQEQMELSKELRKKAIGVDSDNSEEGFTDDDDHDDDDDAHGSDLSAAEEALKGELEKGPEVPKNSLFGLSFMQKAMEKRKQQAMELLNEMDKGQADSGNEENPWDTQEHQKISGRKRFGSRDPDASAETLDAKKDAQEVNGQGIAGLDDDDANDMAALQHRATEKKNTQKEQRIQDRLSMAAQAAALELANSKNTSVDSAPVDEKSKWSQGKVSSGSMEKENDSVDPNQHSGNDLKQAPKKHGVEALPSPEHLARKHHAVAQNVENLKLIQEAFAGAGAEDEHEFQKEKEKLIDEELDKRLQTRNIESQTGFLPGWGSWGGETAKPNPKALAKQVRARKDLEKERAEAVSKRKDGKVGLDHVILSERRHKAGVNKTVPAIPFPYSSKEQYDQTMAIPLGREWQSITTHQRAIDREVKVTPGVPIMPMRALPTIANYHGSHRSVQGSKKRKPFLT